MDSEKFEALISSIEKDISRLSLAEGDLDKLNKEQWHAFFEALAKTLAKTKVTTLDLSQNEIHRLTDAQWLAFWEAIAKSNVTKLYLWHHPFLKHNVAEWQASFEALAKTKVTTLVLSHNRICHLNEAEWHVFFEALAKTNVTTLDLSQNDLHELNDAQWQAFFEALAKTKVTTLVLSRNALYNLSDAQWQAFFEALAKTKVTTLVLSEDGLYNLSDAQWQAFFEALAKTKVTTLALSENGLYNLSDAKWQAFCKALAKTNVTTLVLSDNSLSDLTDAKWQTFCKALAKTNVTTLDLSNNRLSPKRYQYLFNQLNKNENMLLSTIKTGDEKMDKRFAKRIYGPLSEKTLIIAGDTKQGKFLPEDMILEILSFLIKDKATIDALAILSHQPKHLLKLYLDTVSLQGQPCLTFELTQALGDQQNQEKVLSIYKEFSVPFTSTEVVTLLQNVLNLPKWKEKGKSLFFGPKIPESIVEMNKVLNDETLSPPKKIQKIRQYLKDNIDSKETVKMLINYIKTSFNIKDKDASILYSSITTLIDNVIKYEESTAPDSIVEIEKSMIRKM
jgi:uncharacterized protein (DUF1778 family)